MRLGQASAITDTGRKRRRNEDAFVCGRRCSRSPTAWAGAQAGEVASRLAAAALPGARPGDAARSGSSALIQEANRRVYERSSEDAAVSGMGTTMTVALVGGDTVAIGHVGDSRAYLVRDGALEQLTEDHSLVAELVRSGSSRPRRPRRTRSAR